MVLLEGLQDFFTLIQSQLINVPLNNGLAIVYAILNVFMQIGAIFLGGEIGDIGGTGGGGF